MKKDKIIACGLILLLCFFVVFLRMRLISLYSMYNIAKSEVQEETFNNIKDQINKKYPDFPENKKNELAAKSYENYLKQNKYLLEEKIFIKAKDKKSFYQNDNNHTYILGIDSYYWLRLIDNLRKKGHIGESIVKGQNYDDLVGVPIEQSLSRSMHIILGSFIYKIFDSFKLDVDYESGLYLIPLLFSVLLAILTFSITKLLSKSNVAAFFAGIAVNLSPLFMQRTIGEWLDTDIYNVFFPLLIFGAFLFVFKSTNNTRKTLGLVVFSLACAFYASIWQGWWFILDLLIICGLVFILNDNFSDRRNIPLFKENMLWLSLLFISGITLVGILNGRESLFSFITEPAKLIFTMKNIPRDNWPNVFLTVAELKRVSPYAIAHELGGIPIFFITIIGSITMVLSKKVIRDEELGIGFFCLFIWLGVLYYVSLNAVRMALLLVVPFGIMFGIIFDKMIIGVFAISRKFSKKIRLFILAAITIFVYSVVSFYGFGSTGLVSSRLPLMNDAWYKSLMFIRNNSDNSATINSWWDYGHWFTAIAKRHVMFDGKTQNSPVAFWMARVLITTDEEEALGILRMLNISKNKAFDLLESYGFNHVKAVNILEDIIRLPEQGARQYLENILDKGKAGKLISLLYKSNMPSAYFIASFDIIGKMRSISHIGNWDFKKCDIWLHAVSDQASDYINYLKKEYNYTNEEAQNSWFNLRLLSDRDALGWVSKIDSIQSDSVSNKFKKQDNLLLFDNGLVLDLSNYNAYILRGHDTDIGVPYSVIYMKAGVLEEKVLEGSNSEYSVLIFKGDGDAYKNIFLSKDLAKSIFSRMYFFKGEGLKYFKSVSAEKTPEGDFIYVYKIEWPK
ncbi:MAG: STT3 domain-containing protein [Candidatus Omnitrophica bacterium]|nr:STT3 domain-containing protein [Candidatus Omnitrophota bacterium]MDD5351877.1 STT3 domain-containing protein [Candidatus Omnitrophota bacterium]MDD5550703.1 STT3 domain-containing protein [Candidatus Omnitrophota bacterium]